MLLGTKIGGVPDVDIGQKDDFKDLNNFEFIFGTEYNFNKNELIIPILFYLGSDVLEKSNIARNVHWSGLNVSSGIGLKYPLFEWLYLKSEFIYTYVSFKDGTFIMHLDEGDVESSYKANKSNINLNLGLEIGFNIFDFIKVTVNGKRVN